MKPDISEDMVYRYLLGDLPESDQLVLEERFFADREAFERVWAVENDLIDRYVRKRLTFPEKRLFEQNYLSTPVHRDRVDFARTLVVAADSTAERREADSGAESSASWWSSLFASPGRRSWRFAAVAAMLLLLALTSVWLFSERARLRDQMAQTQAERTALGQREQELQRQLAEQQTSNAEAENELALVRDRLAQLEQQLAAGSQHPEQRDLKVIAFSLAPQARGIGQIARLSVPPGTDYLALTLELETNEFPAYQAALKSPATGKIIWRSGKIKAGGKKAQVRLPASLLNQQNYVVELYGMPATGAGEIVSSYPFSVVTQ